MWHGALPVRLRAAIYDTGLEGAGVVMNEPTVHTPEQRSPAPRMADAVVFRSKAKLLQLRKSVARVNKERRSTLSFC
jgi:hypothetical protein